MAAPETLAPGVYRVDAVGLRNAVSVFLIEDEDGWALVDAGVGGSPTRIRDALANLGGAPGDLRRVYLTHHHPDHIGGLSGVKGWAPHATLAAPGREAEIISGARPRDESPNPVFRFVSRFQTLPTGPVDNVLGEGETFAGFRVISTPGHTLGHTSLLRDGDGVLITGDAFGSLRPSGKPDVGGRKFLCTDPPQAKRSAQKLLAEGFSTVAFAHGRALRGTGAREALQESVERCRY